MEDETVADQHREAATPISASTPVAVGDDAPDPLDAQLGPREVLPVPPRAPERPNYGLWIIYLYFRPAYFFRHFVADHLPFLTWTCAILMGISAADGRAERALARNAAFAESFDFWPAFLCLVGAFGLVSAVLFHYLGGWWYRLRLRWSGAINPDRALARRVYLYASTILALPACAHLLYRALTHATPADALWHTSAWWQRLFVVLAFWSIIVSHKGVREVFGVRGWRPALWFLILPMSFYAITVLAAILSLLALMAPATGTASTGSASPAPPPAQSLVTASAVVLVPATNLKGPWEMAFPSDWKVNGDYALGPREWNIAVQVAETGHMWTLQIWSGRGNAVRSLALELDWIQGFPVKQVGTMTTWGRFSGIGKELVVTVDRDVMFVRSFVSELGDGRMLVASELMPEADRARTASLYRAIANSVALTDETAATEPAPR